MYDKYQLALRTLIAIRRHLNIVVVGANDGKTHDPMYDFAMEKSGATNILLIEPNKLLLPYLQSNYSAHPSHRIANCAIGQEGTLTLYAIKQEFWDRYQPAHAKGWPPYRAATGITSAFKSHVEKALEGQKIDPGQAIEVLNIPAKELKTLIEEVQWPTPIDVLQIDAEGYDDVVIVNAHLSYTRPKLIHFESHNMSTEKSLLLTDHLSKHGYKIYPFAGDSLAVECRMNLTCVSVHLAMLIHSFRESILHKKQKLSSLTKGLFQKV